MVCESETVCMCTVRVVERVEHVDQTIGEVKEEINIEHLFNIWRV